MYNGWNSPFYGENRMPFSLTEDYQPNLFNVKSDNITERRYNSELSNGRLAMLAAAHMIASELATGDYCTATKSFLNIFLITSNTNYATR